VRTMEDRVAVAYSPERFEATLLALLAGIALVLASVGLYGLMAEIVSRQTREIGVRIALGARPLDVARRVLGRGLALTGAGLAAGLVGAVALSHLLSGLLFDMAPVDATTYAAVSALLLAVAALATWLPARRAMRVDPIAALRAE
jgi:putative ABC transport system permease protein